MNSVRIDKWLWAARFFKTRALASRACELGRILANGQPAKPAREIRIGDRLQVTNDGGDFQIEVLLLSDVRGPAPVAQTLYRETEPAAKPARRPPTSAAPSRTLRPSPMPVPPSATAARSSASAAATNPATFF